MISFVFHIHIVYVRLYVQIHVGSHLGVYVCLRVAEMEIANYLSKNFIIILSMIIIYNILLCIIIIIILLYYPIFFQKFNSRYSVMAMAVTIMLYCRPIS